MKNFMRLRFPEQIPQTLVTSDMRRLKAFMARTGRRDDHQATGWLRRQRRVLLQRSKIEIPTRFWKRRPTMGDGLSWDSVICRRFAKATNELSCSTASRSARSCAFLWNRDSRQYSRRRTVRRDRGHGAGPRDLRGACAVAARRWLIFRRPGRDRELSHRSQRHQPHRYSGNQLRSTAFAWKAR